ncbi:MAG: VOC family protein [Rubrivivax sp.]
MAHRLALTALLVTDYDEAIDFYTRALRFTLLQDSRLSEHKRWVVVSPSDPAAGAPAGCALLLARAADEAQRAVVGRQGGGRVWLFLHTDDMDADLAHFRAHGVRLAEAPRDEPYGRVVVFLDLYGNRWDLVQPATGIS